MFPVRLYTLKICFELCVTIIVVMFPVIHISQYWKGFMYIRTFHCSILYSQALDKMEEEWEPILLEIIAYKETGTYIMRSGDESAQQLDDHIVMTQAMSFSPYKKPFEARIMTWENKLRITQDVMEEWLVP